jgi:hypothetical protein
MAVDTNSLTIDNFTETNKTQEENSIEANSFSVKMAKHIRTNLKRRKLRTQRTRSRRR